MSTLARLSFDVLRGATPLTTAVTGTGWIRSPHAQTESLRELRHQEAQLAGGVGLPALGLHAFRLDDLGHPCHVCVLGLRGLSLELRALRLCHLLADHSLAELPHHSRNLHRCNSTGESSITYTAVIEA